MNSHQVPGAATPLSATALVLQDGTIVALAAERRSGRANAAGLARFLARSWRNLAWGALCGALFGFFLFLVLPKSYEAKTVIEPSPVAQSLDQQGRLTNLVSGGVRSLLSGDSGLPQMTKDFLQLLNSNIVADSLLKDPRIAAKVFPTSWDPKTQSFHEPTGLPHLMAKTVKGLLGMGGTWIPPGPETMRLYIGSRLTISPIGDGMLQQLTMRTNNAEWSAYLLSKMVKASDQYLRARESRRSQASIDYGQAQLNGVIAQDVRAALISNIVDAQRRVVFAGVDLPFAVDIEDPIIVPRAPAGPNFLLLLLGSIVAGMLLSFTPSLWRRTRDGWRASLAAGAGVSDVDIRPPSSTQW